MNEDTIGTIEVDGVEYDVDWPFGIDPKTAAEHYGDMADAVLELLGGTRK